MVRIQVVRAGATQGRVYAVIRGGKVGAWLEDVVEAADDNAWRRTFREAVAVQDTAKMRASREAEALDQPPGVLDWLGNALRGVGLKEQGLALWQQAHGVIRGTFGSTTTWGCIWPSQSDRTGLKRRWAVAGPQWLRPVAGAYNALGSALYCTGASRVA